MQNESITKYNAFLWFFMYFMAIFISLTRLFEILKNDCLNFNFIVKHKQAEIR